MDNEIDLFENIETLPTEAQNLIEEYNEADDNSLELTEALLEKLEMLGYTFEYGFDGVPFNLTKIND